MHHEITAPRDNPQPSLVVGDPVAGEIREHRAIAEIQITLREGDTIALPAGNVPRVLCTAPAAALTYRGDTAVAKAECKVSIVVFA